MEHLSLRPVDPPMELREVKRTQHANTIAGAISRSDIVSRRHYHIRRRRESLTP
jgi:hypothetical protein